MYLWGAFVGVLLIKPDTLLKVIWYTKLNTDSAEQNSLKHS